MFGKRNSFHGGSNETQLNAAGAEVAKNSAHERATGDPHPYTCSHTHTRFRFRTFTRTHTHPYPYLLPQSLSEFL